MGDGDLTVRKYFLESENIGFSKWEKGDIELARSLWGDKNVTKYICATGVFTEQDIKARLAKEIDTDYNFGVQYWPIFDITTEDLIGCCGLRPYDLENRIYEIGFHIKCKYWGQGIASKGAKIVITYAFDVLNASNIFAGHNPNNTASGKLLSKLGFHYIGDEFYAPTGLNHPSYLYLKITDFIFSTNLKS